ncbi:MAG: hypothetical protein WCW84_02430 [Sulfurimonas sp.]|jgi:hypothetical protein
MNKALLREIAIFGVLLPILALLMHPDFLGNPLLRFNTMLERGNYFHPLVYTTILYSIIAILRMILQLGRRLFFSHK